MTDEQCPGCPHDPHAVRCFRFKPGRHRMEQCPCKERMNVGDNGDSDSSRPAGAGVRVPVAKEGRDA